jgi:acyl transferase domain-containing protein
MSDSKKDSGLAQLIRDVDECEQVVLERIQLKKGNMMPNTVTGQNSPHSPGQLTPIAIVGMASLFPEASTLQQYWENIIHEVDCMKDVPSSRWDIDSYYDPDPKAKDKTYCKRGGFIPDIDFNPMEFGLPPAILEYTDVSQLLSLVVAKQAMEDAGYGEGQDFNRDKAGVVLGAAFSRQLTEPYGARMQYPIWERVLKNAGISDADTQTIIEKIQLSYQPWEENAFPGMLANVIAGRIANRLDFGGLNCAVDAACASSLAAFKIAISELSEGRADLMLAGGVDTDNSIMPYMCFSKTPALSKRQETRPFDENGDGMMLGEGIGILVLKRLADAERDGDRIYAIVKGIGTSSDGRFKSIYAPRPEGQVKAMERAYEEAGFSPATVGLMEAHGTGTAVGDPSEFAALKSLYGQVTDRKQYIALGSVKSQIGHTKAAAGAASLIKVALALHHKILPPTINITKPNPRLGIDDTAFYLNTKTRPWMRTNVPRRAGVSSFGFGGTNYHVVLEEYRSEQPKATYRIHNPAQTILLTAATPAELLQSMQTLLPQLQAEGSDPVYTNLVAASKNLILPVTSARLGFVAQSKKEAISLLETSLHFLGKNLGTESFSHPQGIHYRQSGLNLTGQVAALFSGQGSQSLDMGKDLAMNFPAMRQGFEQFDTLLRQAGQPTLSDVVFPIPVFDEALHQQQVEALQNTQYAQSAIAAFSTGLYRILNGAGFQPSFAAGHSFGELTALWAGGALTDTDYYALVQARGQAMATPAPHADHAEGAMLAVKGTAAQIAALVEQVGQVEQVAIANFNSDQQVVLAGTKDAMTQIQPMLENQGFSVIPLAVSGAFHTPMVAHAQAPFAQAIAATRFQPSQIPVYSNVTGQPYPSNVPDSQQLLQQHMVSQVQFKQEIEAIYAAGGRCFVEFGSRNVLTNLVKEILGDRPHTAIALNGNRHKDSDRQLREAAVQLCVLGLPLQHLDPYQVEAAVPDLSKAKLNYKITAVNQVSEKTQKALDDSLNDGFKVTLPSAIAVQEKAESHAIAGTIVKADPKLIAVTVAATQPQKETILSAPAQAGSASNGKSHSGDSHSGNSHPSNSGHSTNGKGSQPSLNGHSVPESQNGKTVAADPVPTVLESKPVIESKPITPSTSSMSYQPLLESIEHHLAQFNSHQGNVLQVHEQYLKQHMAYAQTVLTLTEQKQSLLLSGATSVDPQVQATVTDSLERSMTQFHENHGETLRVHDQLLKQQGDYAQGYFQLLQQHYGAVLNGAVLNGAVLPSEIPVAPVKAAIAAPQAKQAVVVSPAPKPQELAPVVSLTPPQPQPQPKAEVKPEPKVESKLEPKVELKIEPKPEVKPEIKLEVKPEVKPEPKPEPKLELKIEVKPEPKTEPKTEVKPEPVAQGNSPNVAELQEKLLAIVSDKTGYPSEMLELDMDMEADLGIDSIKRIEILGALQQALPDMPKGNPEDIGELRTLGQIIEQMQTLLNGAETTEKKTLDLALNGLR